MLRVFNLLLKEITPLYIQVSAKILPIVISFNIKCIEAWTFWYACCFVLFINLFVGTFEIKIYTRPIVIIVFFNKWYFFNFYIHVCITHVLFPFKHTFQSSTLTRIYENDLMVIYLLLTGRFLKYFLQILCYQEYSL